MQCDVCCAQPQEVPKRLLVRRDSALVKPGEERRPEAYFRTSGSFRQLPASGNPSAKSAGSPCGSPLVKSAGSLSGSPLAKSAGSPLGSPSAKSAGSPSRGMIAGARGKLTLNFTCENLKNMDTFFMSDPFIVIEGKGEDGCWEERGRTEVVQDCLSPCFETTYAMELVPSKHQELRFRVFDSDGPELDLDKHDLIGLVETSLVRIVGKNRAACKASVAFPLCDAHGNQVAHAKLGTVGIRAKLHKDGLNHFPHAAGDSDASSDSSDSEGVTVFGFGHLYFAPKMKEARPCSPKPSALNPQP